MRGFDPIFNCYDVVSKERIHTDAVGFMTGDIITNFVSNETFVTVVCLSDIIGVLRLEKERLSFIAIPNKHVSKCVFTCKCITDNVISIY